jgi:hypothetical protein
MEDKRSIEMMEDNDRKYVLEGVFTEFCPIHCHCYLRLGYGVECSHQREWRVEKEEEERKVDLLKKRKKIIDKLLNGN